MAGEATMLKSQIWSGLDKAKIQSFYMKVNQGYDFKVSYAETRAWEFYQQCGKRGLNCHVSVGGLDSITLLVFLRSIGIDVPAVSVSALENKSVIMIHKALGVQSIPPLMKQPDIIRKFGYPIISKDAAMKISILQNPTERNRHMRETILTEGHREKMGRRPLSKKWLKLFAGSVEEGAELGYKAAPFLVSDKCCYYMKEKPMNDWAKSHNSAPYMGLMAVEGGRREKSLIINGCNYFGASIVRSAPFAIFTRQDLLQLALDLNVPVPELYGKIVRDPDGTLRTTGAQRSGCSMCGFGIHLEKRPHRFDKLWARNPKEWDFWMHEMKWGDVLDYIGVGWRNPEEYFAEQCCMDGM